MLNIPILFFFLGIILLCLPFSSVRATVDFSQSNNKPLNDAMIKAPPSLSLVWKENYFEFVLKSQEGNFIAAIPSCNAHRKNFAIK